MNDTEPRHSLLGIYQAFIAQNEQSKPLKENKKTNFFFPIIQFDLLSKNWNLRKLLSATMNLAAFQ